MKQKIFTIYDSAAKAYLNPFFLPEEGMAMRTFKQCCNDLEHSFARTPQDYTLFCIGAWDDNNGQIITNKDTIKLANGIELIEHRVNINQMELTNFDKEHHQALKEAGK